MLPLGLHILEFFAAGFVAGTEFVDLGFVVADLIVFGPNAFDVGGVDHEEEEHEAGGDVVAHGLVPGATCEFFERGHGGAASFLLLLHEAAVGDEVLLEGGLVDGVVEIESVDEVLVGRLDGIEVGIVGDIVHQSRMMAAGVVDGEIFFDKNVIADGLGSLQAVGINLIYAIFISSEGVEVSGIDRGVVVDECRLGLRVPAEGGEDGDGGAIGLLHMPEIHMHRLALLQIEGDAVLDAALVVDDDGGDGGLFDRLSIGKRAIVADGNLGHDGVLPFVGDDVELEAAVWRPMVNGAGDDGFLLVGLTTQEQEEYEEELFQFTILFC